MRAEEIEAAREHLEEVLFSAIGKAVVNFSRFDRNLAWTLRSVMFALNLNPKYSEIEDLTTNLKIDQLDKTIHEHFASSNPELVTDFEHWLQEASRLRKLRNDFVHGIWGVDPSNEEICFTSQALTTQSETRYKLHEFKTQIQAIIKLNSSLQKFRNQYPDHF